MNVFKGLHKGTFTVQGGALLIRGMIHGDLRIDGDAEVELAGMVRGNVVLTSGTLRLPGIVNGDVLNRGGMLNVTGLVKGSITTEAAGTTNVQSPSSSKAAQAKPA